MYVRLLAMMFFVFILNLIAVAGKYNLERAHKVTSEDEAELIEKLNQITDYTPVQVEESQSAIELGRTWYDYASNNVSGRMIAHSQNGIHCVFMKIFPTSTSERYVTYDYYDNGLGIFFGNASVTETRRTGWGRVINGKNNEAIISLHADPSELYFDAGEAGYSFTSKLAISPLGVFAGFGVHGDSIVFVSLHNNTAGTIWMPGNNEFKYSTDYGATWSDGANIPPQAITVEFSDLERMPQFNPTNPAEIGLGAAWSEDASASAGGWLIYAKTTDWGTNWQVDDYWYDDISVTSSPFGNNTQYVIENFTQMNYLYSSDGNFHTVYGAVQGVRDSSTSTAIDYWPILHWDSNSGTFSEVTTLDYSAPNDAATMTAMSASRPGNGLGNAYPHLAEGPNGTLVCIWQQWERNPIDSTVVLINATTGGGTGTLPIFATDIWAAYSNDGGATWQGQTKIAGTSNESDVYPNMTRDATRVGDSLYLDLLYMWDTNASASLAGFSTQTDPSECIWYYERVAIYAPPPTGINDGGNAVADRFSLSQNYPNPFNPSTTISFNVQKRAKVTLNIFNTLGQKVATLLNGEVNPGAHEVEFSGNDLTSGIYFYQLTVDNFKRTKKMVLMK
jgi:hypothetical protein